MPSVHLIMLGTGPLTPQIESEVAQSGLEECVHLLGARTDVAELLPAADLLLLPSHVEGIPGAVLEAAAVEVPTVAYDVGGVRELVQTGITGATVPPGDEERFTGAVTRLLKDKPTRDAMGRKARGCVIARHSILASALRFEELYVDLVAEAKA